MKSPSIAIGLIFATAVFASAITETDLTAAAIAGKTLTFTIEGGVSPFATNGTWTGKFGTSPGNTFAVRGMTGNTEDSDGTWTFNSAINGMYEYTLKPFITGQPDGILTIWISNGAGRYEIFLDGLFGKAQTGGFTIGSTVVVKTPEINVYQPSTSKLGDGKTPRSFGTVVVGKTGTARKFIIKNSGNATLKKLAIRKDGSHAKDFIVGTLSKTSLAAGESASFNVSFKPSAKGTRKAAIHIASNDADENPFDIKLSGAGASK